jgi:hypothetical protein
MKNLTFKQLFILILSLSFVVTSCNKDNEDPLPVDTATTGSIDVDIEHVAGDESFQFDKLFINEAGDSLYFNKFKYYLSNFKLVKADGSIVTLDKSEKYFLVDNEVLSSLNLALDSVPTGTYTGLEFTLGLDSITNTLPVSERTGVLDPSNGMYWSWNSGYIFLKAEGLSPQSTVMGGTFTYHIGGFGGYTSATINNIKTVRIVLEAGKTFTLAKNGSKELHVMADVLELFKSPTSFSVKDQGMVMFAPFSTTIADNYVDMFKLDHVH